MRNRFAAIWLMLCFGLASLTWADQNQIDIPFTKFVLKNGLTVLVHEDHKAPIVAVNIWYHVGSKNEKPGRTGFAHLFEHLMFNGSENYNSDYFKVMERIGATDLNGTTNNDRTNYFENIPTSALDVALWMESDRMGHLLGAIDQAKLDEQRGVVQNEKRQGENEPYGIVEELVTKATYPAAHPYSWTVIGSMSDLSAASLQDVKDWFTSYYGAANAVLSIAGDIDPQTAKAKVEKYFGDIPSGPPVEKFKAWVAPRSGMQRQVAEDRVPQARLYKVWNVPEWGSQDATYLDLTSDILASGKTSRLYNRLVYKDQIATRISAYMDAREIGSQFCIDATAKPGVSLAQIEKAVDEEMAAFLANGPTAQELQRVKTQYMAGFIRGMERIGGFGGKSDILASNEVFAGDAGHYKTTFNWVKESTTDQIWAAAKKWLSDGVYILEVHPYGNYETVNSDVDRKKVPEPLAPPDAKFPTAQRATLSNGLSVVLAERHTIPVVLFNLSVDAGYAADQFAKPGTAKLAMNMLDEGTKTRNALEISDELALLGANLSSGSSLDISSVSLNAIKMNLEKSLDIFSDVILHPSFPEKEFMRLQKQQMAEIQQEKASPITMALRVVPSLIYGSSHAYGNPYTGSGYESSVKAIAVQDLAKFHQTWFKPNNATMVVVGDITMAELKPMLEKLFTSWKSGSVPKKNISTVASAAKSTIYLMDKPGAQQSVVIAAHLAPPKSDASDIAIETMNNILGGTFTSRLNMNIREDKHWSYGAGSVVLDSKSQRTFLAYAPVQADKTKETVEEISNEFKGVLGAKPINGEELDNVQKYQILGLAGQWETMGAVSQSLREQIIYQLPDNYFTTYAAKVKAIKLADLNTAAKKVLIPEHNVWVVVGDRQQVEAPLTKLGYEIKYLDGDGKVQK